MFQRIIEKGRVTCVKWLPKSKSNFLVSYSTGQMYLFKEDLSCSATAPNYQQFKSGDGFTIYSCKAKSTRNPIIRWQVGVGSINEFAFSPCGHFIAIVSQDGFLRVFHYDRVELIGCMRSYFGGLLCLSWSPDSKFIVTGGEDDLISVWSLADKRVIARGQGHKSWVNVVTFDPYMTIYGNSHGDKDLSCNKVMVDEEERTSSVVRPIVAPAFQSSSNGHFNTITSYRIGSVGQDTQICLWDLTDDIIRQSMQVAKSRSSVLSSGSTVTATARDHHKTSLFDTTDSVRSLDFSAMDSDLDGTKKVYSDTLNSKKSTKSKEKHSHSNGKAVFSGSGHKEKEGHGYSFLNNLIKSKNHLTSQEAMSVSKSHKATFSLGSNKSNVEKHHNPGSTGTQSSTSSAYSSLNSATNCSSLSSSLTNSSNALVKARPSSFGCDPVRLLGTVTCPRLDEVPMLEPHICKRISSERLTALIFRQDYFVIANQDGKVTLFARPNPVSVPV